MSQYKATLAALPIPDEHKQMLALCDPAVLTNMTIEAQQAAMARFEVGKWLDLLSKIPQLLALIQEIGPIFDTIKAAWPQIQAFIQKIQELFASLGTGPVGMANPAVPATAVRPG